MSLLLLLRDIRELTNRQPVIVYYVDFGGNAEIYIVPDPGVLHQRSVTTKLEDQQVAPKNAVSDDELAPLLI